MPLIPISGPAVEPVSLGEAKAHLRVDGTDEDLLISSLITAARVHIEQTLMQAMITQSWRLVRDDWPADGPVEIALGPVQQVSEIRVLDADGSSQIIPASDYLVDTASAPVRIVRAAAAVWPAPTRAINGIEIDFSAGYGDSPSDVPQPLRQAILLLVAHWFERREPVAVGANVVRVPETVGGLIAPYRRLDL